MTSSRPLPVIVIGQTRYQLTRHVLWASGVHDDYLEWKRTDAKRFERIQRLVVDIDQHPFTGLGKPEPLRHNLAGTWSRHVRQEHRLIYHVDNQGIHLYSVRDHY
ncbi:MAG: Txe/YoeB family addiction module toxin [Bifidobacterium tibiigranuli]|uniref:Txe/YoeB family addiction module toxin n=1 Tax=Bifidobacterium tibiigranuli TaxID=2172043 RepID=UPI0026F05143|nr:Txe/YoeB family addiction module toxin [Bifidobacterium tibiigranuli]MCI1673686.1 Txe/YoeB family addiction module toxin [Bifidobacterium tibiigranuli]MCI1712942.1 Txe/YoeB family addiction module toxin [Bifidobacterium tibiigranuli]MCI1833551.1 Txe/YoeB family addiction module toxin [Bifidobacterium tibiigranuli]